MKRAAGNVLGYENDCLDSVTGNYKTKQTYSYDNLYQLIKVDGETTYNPYQSSVPEFVSAYSQSFSFDEAGRTAEQQVHAEFRDAVL